MNKIGESETGERITSFERAETNHDKVALPKQQSNETSIYIVHNLHKLSSCVFCGQLPRICDPCGLLQWGAFHSTKYSGSMKFRVYSMRRMEQYFPVTWTNPSQLNGH